MESGAASNQKKNEKSGATGSANASFGSTVRGVLAVAAVAFAIFWLVYSWEGDYGSCDIFPRVKRSPTRWEPLPEQYRTPITVFSQTCAMLEQQNGKPTEECLIWKSKASSSNGVPWIKRCNLWPFSHTYATSPNAEEDLRDYCISFYNDNPMGHVDACDWVNVFGPRHSRNY